MVHLIRMIMDNPHSLDKVIIRIMSIRRVTLCLWAMCHSMLLKTH